MLFYTEEGGHSPADTLTIIGFTETRPQTFGLLGGIAAYTLLPKEVVFIIVLILINLGMDIKYLNDNFPAIGS